MSAVVLTWHVDYWDRLGWKDPFGSKEASARQRAYGKAREQKNVWTPQFVVAGEVVPNRDARGIPERVKRAANDAADIAIEATAVLDGKSIRTTIRIRPTDEEWAPAETVGVVPVLYRREAQTAIPKGENEGRTVTEYFVVLTSQAPLSIATARSDDGVTATFELPDGLTAAELGVAVLVEDSATVRTLQCTTVPVTKPAPPTTAPDDE